MRQVHVPAKRHTIILNPIRFKRTEIMFAVEAADGGPVSGKIEERRKAMFGPKSTLHDLQSEHQFRVGGMVHGYRLAVIPNQDVVVTFHTRHWQPKDLFIAVALVFVGFGVLGAVLQALGLSAPPP